MDGQPNGSGESAARDAAPSGLPSDAELTRWANQLFSAPPGGMQVPTSATPHGTSGAPQPGAAPGTSSATTLDPAEEQHVHSVLHRSSGAPSSAAPSGAGSSAPPALGAPAFPSVPQPTASLPTPGNARGGFGRSLPDPAHDAPAGLGSTAPWSGASPEAWRSGSPLGATANLQGPLDAFPQVEDERVWALLPSRLARPFDAPFGNSQSAAPASGTGSSPPSAGSAPAPREAPRLAAPDSPYYFLHETPAAIAAAKSRPDVAPVTGPPGARRTETWSGRREFDVHAIRRDFPILSEQVNGRQLVWFDNAATTQKPTAVIERLVRFYEHENSNIHRAAHELAARATDAYEDARETARRFINASDRSEIIFVRGTTEAINLVAQSWGRQNVESGDEILITHLEHHANIVPWQQLANEKKANLRVAPVDDSGQVKLDDFQRLMSRRTRIVAFSQVSNALGTITPAREMIDIAHRYGAKVLLDGAQSIAHLPTDVQSLDADWFAFSGHKVYGPTGIGVLFGKSELLNSTLPWQGGGNMIQDVTLERSTFQPAPNRFEAGTGNIADAVGLGAALNYLESIGVALVNRYEHELLQYGINALRKVKGLTLIGTAAEKASVLSFVLQGHDNQEVGKALNSQGIAVRAGHHCAQPILRRFGLESTVRPSLALYNTTAEIDALVEALERIRSGRT